VGRRTRFVDKARKRYSDSLSGYATRRIVLRNDETDTATHLRSDPAPEGKDLVMHVCCWVYPHAPPLLVELVEPRLYDLPQPGYLLRSSF